MLYDWNPLIVLPNCKAHVEIVTANAALLPFDDPVVLSLRKARPRFGEFVSRFTDAFERPLEPAVICIRVGASSPYFSSAAVGAFRDSIAMSVVPYQRAKRLVDGFTLGIGYADQFALYPWMADRRDEGLVAYAPGLGGVQAVEAFRGTSSPEIDVRDLVKSDIDYPLLTYLLVRWETKFASTAPDWKNEALFRSLNMAYHAAKVPAGPETTLFDHGRLVALWVSAFEILVHPGDDGQSSRAKVRAALDCVKPAQLDAISSERADPSTTPSAKERRWLCDRLYDVRNDFLHGNPVEADRLKLSNGDLTMYAAVLYRLLLTGFHNVHFSEKTLADAGGKLGTVADYISFAGYQEMYEEAVVTARSQKARRG